MTKTLFLDHNQLSSLRERDLQCIFPFGCQTADARRWCAGILFSVDNGIIGGF